MGKWDPAEHNNIKSLVYRKVEEQHKRSMGAPIVPQQDNVNHCRPNKAADTRRVERTTTDGRLMGPFESCTVVAADVSVELAEEELAVRVLLLVLVLLEVAVAVGKEVAVAVALVSP